MDQSPSPFSPIPITNRTKRPPVNDTPSPPSSVTTSPPSSPTTSARRQNHNQITSSHLFGLSFHPYNSKEETESVVPHSHPNNDPATSTPHGGVSILPCAVLRGRSPLMVVRRRPSAIEMALSEERSRCDCDSIERQGLDLMEPRPVDQCMATRFDNHARTVSGASMTGNSQRRSSAGTARESLSSDGRPVVVQQPRFVMGGIFEVMEGRA